ncbi:MAG: M23 family metallopeptidase [Verrucomicrobiales bacterium]|nr:M23 family metallopeptidase [Verrucomicrobiales bacterium]MCP5557747.1 M23 family metallopeptidase [Verrucomicrobiaceae bacterium]
MRKRSMLHGLGGLGAAIVLGLAGLATAQIQPMGLVLPTENSALLAGSSGAYFQFIDRTFEGEKSTPWEGGQFGFVRDPRRIGGRLAYSRFHEGMDVKPVRRDSRGDPLDEVRAIAAGTVLHVAKVSSQSNYGRYIVVKHDWGYGPFLSLYAHLREASVEPGDKVATGQKLGIMGYTGAGIDQRRAHTHVELNLFLSSRFEQWHNSQFNTPNHHGMYNGLNLIGLDIAGLFQKHAANPKLTAAEFVTTTPTYYRVLVPGSADMELIKNYPWLLAGEMPSSKPASWEIAFSSWGLPVAIKASTSNCSLPSVTWVKDDPIPHYYNTRGCLTGSGPTAKLTVSGMNFVKLACGAF